MAPPSAARPLRGNAAFKRLWYSETVAYCGSAISAVALPLLAVQTLKATPFQVGLLVAAENAAWLAFGLPAGAWVDRWNKRRIVVTSYWFRTLCIASVPVAAALGSLSLAHLYTVALLIGTLEVFFSVAQQAFLPAIVLKEDLVAANGRTNASKSTASILGPAIGGGLSQLFTPAGALLVDAFGFAASARLMAGVPNPPAFPSAERAGSLRGEIVEGLHYVLRDARLRALTFCSAQFNLFFGAQQALIMVFLVREIGLEGGQIGGLLGVAGAAGVLAAWMSSLLVARLGLGGAALATTSAGTLLGLLVPAAFGGLGVVLFAVGYAGLTVAIVVFSVVSGSFRQATCPPELLGRMVATTRFLTWGSVPLGGLLGGALAELAGVRPALWTIAVGFACCPLWLALTSTRNLDEDPVEPR